MVKLCTPFLNGVEAVGRDGLEAVSGRTRDATTSAEGDLADGAKLSRTVEAHMQDPTMDTHLGGEGSDNSNVDSGWQDAHPEGEDSTAQ